MSGTSVTGTPVEQAAPVAAVLPERGDAEPAAAATPGPILALVSGARRAQLVLAAVELDVFTRLADGPHDASHIASRTGIVPDWAPTFLDALVSTGLIERRSGAYLNSALAQRYLVAGSESGIAGFLRFLDRTLHPAWAQLATSLRTGRPANLDASGGDPYGALFADAEDRRAFFDAMDVLNAPIGEALAALDWTGHNSFADIGGARGSIAARIAQAHPHLHAEVFDLPEVEAEFHAKAAGWGLGERVRFRAGDFFEDPLPSADALIFGHVLHNWPVDRRRQLLQAAFRALPAGGQVLLYDPVIDPERPSPAALLASLNMLVWSAGGSEYTVAQASGWLTEAGFVKVASAALGPTSTLITATRP